MLNHYVHDVVFVLCEKQDHMMYQESLFMLTFSTRSIWQICLLVENKSINYEYLLVYFV